jgi:DNA mismatch repair protein MutS2
MLDRHLHTLEFDKVRDALVRHCSFAVSESLAAALAPSTDEALVRRAQDGTSEARRLLEVRPNSGLRGARDIRPHLRRAGMGAPLQPAELIDVASTIAASRSIKALLVRQELHTPTLARVARNIVDLDDLEDSIRLAIDDEGQVLDTASDELRQIRTALRTAYDRLMRRLNELIASTAFREALQDPVISMRGGRFVVPVKSDFRGRVRGIVHDQSASGATLFVEPLQVVELANRWREHQLEETHEIERILQVLSDSVGGSRLVLADMLDALAQIDLALAMGKLALEMEATRPLMQSIERLRPGEPVAKLTSARHPLLRGEVVPIDVELGADFDVLLITGPNTGGKTVALKTVGLLALMAQAGLQIPAADGSRLGIFSGVYADIGDEQSIEQSLSTFSSHVTRIVEILGAADRHALVLLDEIGAGTDPQEGSALSRAILNHLVAKRVFTIATTHYSELKHFAYATARVENASVEFDPVSLRPTFHLTIGLPGRSNALAIAERLGMPESVIADARSFTAPEELHADDLLAEIQGALRGARDERAEAGRLKTESERLTQQLRARLAAVEQERAQLLAEADDERAAIVAELRREADDVRRDLRRLRAERERLTAIDDRIARLPRSHAARPLPTASDEPPALATGDAVRINSLGTSGVVRSVSTSGDNAEVEVGGMRVHVRTSDLVRVQGESRTSPRERAVASGYLAPSDTPRRVTSEGWAPIQSQVDLRGLTTEEARFRLDQYLNEAYMEGLSTVRVVHGKGTGAVRQAVRDLLSDHPLVRSHETAEQREGGDGATVVQLAS